MNNQHPLSDIASLYQHDKQQFQNALAELGNERKTQTLSQRIYDFIANTSTEEALAKYNEQFDRTEKEARYRVDRWVDNNVVHKLKEMGEFNAWIDFGNDRFKTEKFAEKVNKAINLGERALYHLDGANNACRKARNMELADAVSTSKAVAAASAAANSNARHWLREAEQSVHHYLSEFKDNNVTSAPVKSSIADVDFVVDMLFPGVPDFLSFANFISFDSAADRCKKSYEEMKRSMQPLYATREILLNDERNMGAKMDEISNRTRDQLQQTIPKELTDVINPNNSVSYQSYMDPLKHAEITELASNISLTDFIKSQVKPESEKANDRMAPSLSL